MYLTDADEVLYWLLSIDFPVKNVAFVWFGSLTNRKSWSLSPLTNTIFLSLLYTLQHLPLWTDGFSVFQNYWRFSIVLNNFCYRELFVEVWSFCNSFLNVFFYFVIDLLKLIYLRQTLTDRCASIGPLVQNTWSDLNIMTWVWYGRDFGS